MRVIERIDSRIKVLSGKYQLEFFEHRMLHTSIVTDNLKPVEKYGI